MNSDELCNEFYIVFCIFVIIFFVIIFDRNTKTIIMRCEFEFKIKMKNFFVDIKFSWWISISLLNLSLFSKTIDNVEICQKHVVKWKRNFYFDYHQIYFECFSHKTNFQKIICFLMLIVDQLICRKNNHHQKLKTLIKQTICIIRKKILLFKRKVFSLEKKNLLLLTFSSLW